MQPENPEHYRYMPGQQKVEEPKPEPILEAEPVSEPTVQLPPPPEIPLQPVENEVGNAGVLRFLYAVCSPLMVPTYVSLILFLLTILAIVVPGGALAYSLTVFGATCLVPSIANLILLKIGALSSLSMPTARERVVPYIIEFCALGGVTLFFIYKGANPWLWTIYCGATAACLVNFLLNFRIRVSNHCTAMAAFVAALIVINTYGMPQHSLFWWMVGTVFFAGYAGTFALIQGRHTLLEVLAGYATGFLGVILFSLIH